MKTKKYKQKNKNKKITIELAVGIIVLIALAFGGYLIFETKKVQTPKTQIINQNNLPTGNNQNIKIANPASVYCGQNDGTSEIRTASDGSQTGYCKFSDGSECEEWAFMRGECKNNSTVDTTNWKTFENKKYGIRFQCPKEFEVIDKSGEAISLKSAGEGIEAPVVEIDIKNSKKDQLMAEAKTKLKNLSYNTEDIIVGNKKGSGLTIKEGLGINQEIFIELGIKDTFYINAAKMNDAAMNRMLASFEFTK